MTPQERKSLAEQITTNPLFVAVIDDMERSATEALIFAKPEDTVAAQLRVQAIRHFRADLRHALSTPPQKSAPA
jgi:hypothetical protein